MYPMWCVPAQSKRRRETSLMRVAQESVTSDDASSLEGDHAEWPYPDTAEFISSVIKPNVTAARTPPAPSIISPPLVAASTPTPPSARPKAIMDSNAPKRPRVVIQRHSGELDKFAFRAVAWMLEMMVETTHMALFLFLLLELTLPLMLFLLQLSSLVSCACVTHQFCQITQNQTTTLYPPTTTLTFL